MIHIVVRTEGKGPEERVASIRT